jgi:hypothetical protein
MQSTIQAAPVSRTSLWAGRILSWIVLLFLIFDGVTKVLKASPSVKGTMELGYSEALVPVIGMILLVCVLFNELFPIYFAGLVWLALFLQDGRLRELVPFRSRRAVS